MPGPILNHCSLWSWRSSHTKAPCSWLWPRLNALEISKRYPLQFVSLRPNLAFAPKGQGYALQVSSFELQYFPFASEKHWRLHAVCPVRALHTYVEQTRDIRFANPARGRVLSKLHLSH